MSQESKLGYVHSLVSRISAHIHLPQEVMSYPPLLIIVFVGKSSQYGFYLAKDTHCSPQVKLVDVVGEIHPMDYSSMDPSSK
jgi:hypothetical protein